MVKRKFETDVQIVTLKDNLFHSYFSYISIAKDSVSPIGICKMEMPYIQESLDYWIKYDGIVVISFMIKETNNESYLEKLKIKNRIKNDEYNYSFIGRINKIKHKSNKVIILLDDIGWKFEQKVPKDFRDKYIAGQPLDDAFQAICEFMDVRFCYNIEELNKYTFADDGYSVQKDGETIEEIKDIFDLIIEKDQQDSLDNPYHENEGLSDYDEGRTSSKDTQDGKNTKNQQNTQGGQSTQNGQNTQNNQEENQKNLEEKKKKYEKDFKQKIQDLFTGNKYYDSNLTSSILDYGAITIQPKANITTNPVDMSQVNSDGNTSETPNTDTTSGSSSSSGSSN